MLKRVCLCLFVVAALLPALFSSCQKEEMVGLQLKEVEFSCDTMAFDTVFTQMGTTTRYLMVYNRGQQTLHLSSVTLEGGRASRFRLNVDGDTNMEARDLQVLPGDSMFVFVRANINPNSSTEPFLIEDAILFRSDDAVRRLPLTAYGRNAVYHVPTDTLHTVSGEYLQDMYGKPYAYSVIDCEHWRHDLPHVILGYAVVDSRQTLHLQAGDELYFCDNAVLWVFDSATLDVRGSAERPVVFTSVRHDGWYDYLPGQWGHIWLYSGSKNSHIEHALIENAFSGIVVDSCANENPTLTINNVQIRNHSLAGMMLQTAWVEGENLLVTNCGTATVAMQYGGKYRFERCTFADYWRYESRKYPSVFVTNTRDYEGIHYVWPMDALLKDCIIYGSRTQGELLVELDDAVSARAVLDHCLVRGGEWDEDPLFEDVEEGNYRLKEDSPAQGIGYQYPLLANKR